MKGASSGARPGQFIVPVITPMAESYVFTLPGYQFELAYPKVWGTPNEGDLTVRDAEGQEIGRLKVTVGTSNVPPNKDALRSLCAEISQRMVVKMSNAKDKLTITESSPELFPFLTGAAQFKSYFDRKEKENECQWVLMCDAANVLFVLTVAAPPEHFEACVAAVAPVLRGARIGEETQASMMFRGDGTEFNTFVSQGARFSIRAPAHWMHSWDEEQRTLKFSVGQDAIALHVTVHYDDAPSADAVNLEAAAHAALPPAMREPDREAGRRTMRVGGHDGGLEIVTVTEEEMAIVRAVHAKNKVWTVLLASSLACLSNFRAIGETVTDSFTVFEDLPAIKLPEGVAPEDVSYMRFTSMSFGVSVPVQAEWSIDRRHVESAAGTMQTVFVAPPDERFSNSFTAMVKFSVMPRLGELARMSPSQLAAQFVATYASMMPTFAIDGEPRIAPDDAARTVIEIGGTMSTPDGTARMINRSLLLDNRIVALELMAADAVFPDFLFSFEQFMVPNLRIFAGTALPGASAPAAAAASAAPIRTMQ